MMKKLVSFALIASLVLCAPVAFASDIGLSDIDSSHWAYAAISELVAKKTVNGFEDGTFRPNGIVTFDQFEKMITGVWTTDNPNPIDRESALDMLWEHNGKPVGFTAPGIITSQMENGEAAAWGFATGLMQGNDKLNLRPADTLTRAESAALIVRADNLGATRYNFADGVSDDILKVIWDSYKIFNSEYVADEKVTAEELTLAVEKLTKTTPSVLKITGATVEDAAFAIMHGSLLQKKESVAVKSMAGVSDKYGVLPKISYAYSIENGVILPKAKNEPATKRDVAILLIQVDDLNGRDGVKINKDLSLYPENAADYTFITEGIPTAVYSTPFDNNGVPAKMYSMTGAYPYIFETFLDEMENKFSDKAEFTFYPTLACQGEGDTILRVKCNVKDATATAIFGNGFENAGKEFFMDIHVGESIANLYIPTTNAKIGKFICNK